MILEGNERGSGAQLARHLLNPRDNDHVTVHAVEGFVADDLFGAFAEAEAISGATQCRKYLFSLSLNPPPGAEVPVEVFEETIDEVERRLGLAGQPRAIVFHEKNARRHAHAVWSRIDGEKLKAINLPHYKRKLFSLSRDLYLSHGWEMPAGFKDLQNRDPLNFSRQEAGQAKRVERDPKALKAMFRQFWEVSDTRAAFEAALKEQGFLLARGDRRGFVAVDAAGRVWSLSRWCGVKPKALRARLGDEDELPSVEYVVAQCRDLSVPPVDDVQAAFEAKRHDLIKRQRTERDTLLKAQEQQRIAELQARQARLPTGLRGLLARATGRYDQLLKRFEEETREAQKQNRAAQQALISKHLKERKSLSQDLNWQRTLSLSLKVQKEVPSTLILPNETLPFSKAELLKSPKKLLAHLSEKNATFTRTDVLRLLAKRIDDPTELKNAADRAIASKEVVPLPDPGDTPAFTTKDYRTSEEALDQATNDLANANGFAVDQDHIRSAIGAQNIEMRRAFGGRLSDEQVAALNHAMDDKQLTSVVGLAGAGKSTLLATAKDAWDRQGFNVHGAALAGKAAEELQNASGITTRTLASLELSLKNGYEPIAAGDILVIDEAGMIGTRQMARITAKIKEIGAKLVLVGDPDQLQPIEAGTPFRRIVDKHGAARLAEIHRQRASWQKQASRDLAAGEISKAIAQYRSRDAVMRCEDRTSAIEALVETYAMDALANEGTTSRLAFAHRRKDVHALNQGIREALRSGQNSPPETLFQTDTGPRAFATHDRIAFTRNDKDIGVKNGMLGTVITITEDEITVLLDGNPDHPIRFNPKDFQSFDHGYAVTIHKSQGATVDQAYILASRAMDNHLAYVAMTRHRDDMRLFINERDCPKWGVEQEQILYRFDKRHRFSGPSMG